MTKKKSENFNNFRAQTWHLGTRPLIILLLLLCWHRVEAAEKVKEPIVCNGDQVEYFKEEKKVVGTGNVVITYKDMTLTCDKATVWTETKDAQAEGNVKLTQGEGVVEGERIEYNFEKNTGKITGDVRAEFKPWYARGKEGERVSEDTYVIRKGYLTTCEHEFPHWKLSANRVEIRPGITATTYNAFMWANPLPGRGYIPLLWVPYYCHPLDDDRPHVTLIPGKNKEWGLYLLTAWRYHLSPNQKGNVLLDWRENKDVASGIDYIYNTELFGKGNIRGYYMNERDAKQKHNYHRYTKKKWRDVWGHEREYAWQPTTEEEKGLLRIRHQWEINENTELTTEMHKYKDEDFLKDYFFKEYEKDSRPESYVLLTNTNQLCNVSLLTKKRMNRFDTVTELLPEAQVNFNNRPVFGREQGYDAEGYDEEQSGWRRFSLHNFYYSGDLKAVNMNQVYPRHTDDNPGTITDPQHNNIYDAYSRLSYVSKLAFLNVTPYAGMRQTYFQREIDSKDPRIRGVFYTGTDVSTKFFKIFRTKSSPLGMEINDLRHVITPTISYNYNPPPTLSPDKVFGDGISRNNVISLGLENKLQTKRGSDLHSVDLAMLLVNTSYDFQHTPGTQFLDYTAKLELRPFDWLIATSDAIIDPHHLHQHEWLKQLDNSISFSIKDKGSLGIGHSYVPGSNRVALQGKLEAIPGWSFNVYEDIDIRTTRRGGLEQWMIREQQYVINRDLHCWNMEVRYNVNRDKGEEIMVIFRLKEFPEIPFEFGKGYHNPKVGSQQY